RQQAQFIAADDLHRLGEIELARAEGAGADLDLRELHADLDVDRHYAALRHLDLARLAVTAGFHFQRVHARSEAVEMKMAARIGGLLQRGALDAHDGAALRLSADAAHPSFDVAG